MGLAHIIHTRMEETSSYGKKERKKEVGISCLFFVQPRMAAAQRKTPIPEQKDKRGSIPQMDINFIRRRSYKVIYGPGPK